MDIACITSASVLSRFWLTRKEQIEKNKNDVLKQKQPCEQVNF